MFAAVLIWGRIRALMEAFISTPYCLKTVFFQVDEGMLFWSSLCLCWFCSYHKLNIGTTKSSLFVINIALILMEYCEKYYREICSKD